jgi:hypothetical protein
VSAFVPHSLVLIKGSATASISQRVLRTGKFSKFQMCEQGKSEEKVEVDPFAVKPVIPSFAKTENQWKIDETAGAAPDDSAKKAVAITTGAIALVISVLYLLAVVALEARGPLQPPPPEALVSLFL